NVVRALMVKASNEHGRDPRRLSFKGALQTLQEFAPGLREGSPPQRRWLWTILLSSIASDTVGNRPDRVEPQGAEAPAQAVPLVDETPAASQSRFAQSRLELQDVPFSNDP